MASGRTSSSEEQFDELLRAFVRRMRTGQSVDLAGAKEALGEDYPRFEELLRSQVLLLGGKAAHALAVTGGTIGDYRVGRELGQGASAVVYEATDPSGAAVALKVLRPAWAADSGFRERFLREARLLAQASHANVVSLLGQGEVSGRPYLVLEHIAGRPLSAGAGVVADDVAMICTRAAALARGVAHLHALGVVHRDIKPANILVKADGTWVLSDLGAARDHRSADPAYEAMGTVSYMSPEERMGGGGAGKPANDVYALGCTLLTVLGGPEALHSVDRMSRLHARAFPEGVPSVLRRIVRRCMAPRAADRYLSAGALANDLDRAAAVLSSPASRAPWAGWRIGRRLRWQACLAPGAAILIAFLAWRVFAAPQTSIAMRSVPGAKARIVGDRYRVLPATFSCDPGRVLIEGVAPGFQPIHRAFTAEEGVRAEFVLPMIPADPTDRARVAQFFDLLGLDAANLAAMADAWASSRGPADAAGALVVFPRGRVSADDLGRAHIEFIGTLPRAARWTWRTGTEVIAQAELPVRPMQEPAIPQGVRDAARPGQEISLEVSAQGRVLASVVLTVATAPSLQQETEGASPVLGKLEEVLRLRQAGHFTAALAAVINSDPSERSSFLLRVAMGVLREAVDDDPRLPLTSLWQASYNMLRTMEGAQGDSRSPSNDNGNSRLPVPDRASDGGVGDGG